mmetsp:Transcript_5845/g.22775  ORF Transcript_5845/g.22775 Transcript_5845/m.22775 type:complete len:98 (+) Transcript_5845:95-388(+)
MSDLENVGLSLNDTKSQLDSVGALMPSVEGVALCYLERIHSLLTRNHYLLTLVHQRCTDPEQARICAPWLQEVNQNIAEIARSVEALRHQADLAEQK